LEKMCLLFHKIHVTHFAREIEGETKSERQSDANENVKEGRKWGV